MNRLKAWWSTIYLWLTRVEPTYETQSSGSRDRTLAGKARRKARRSGRV